MNEHNNLTENNLSDENVELLKPTAEDTMIEEHFDTAAKDAIDTPSVESPVMMEDMQETDEISTQPHSSMLQVEEVNTSAMMENHNQEVTTEHMDTISSSLDDDMIEEQLHPHEDQKATFSEEPITIEKIKKPPFLKRHKGAAILAGALIISSVGGFGGAYIALNMNDNNGNAVFYQGVDTSSNKNVNTSTTDVSDIAGETMNSVVEIQTESLQTNSMLSQAVTKGAGSGVILSKDGYIVTNNHVIDGANKITVITRDGKSYEAELIGKDSQSDLAVLKIDATDLTPAVLGDSSKLEVGDAAIAIGNPLGELGGTVTSGIISALDRDITVEGETMTLLQTNAAINSGNSGGGLFNAKGELIGIVNAKTSGSGIEGLGFAIPINDAKDVIEQLMENGYVADRASLGVSLVDVADEMSAFRAGVESTGTYISSVSKDSAADEADLQVKDRIISIDGKEIASATEAVAAVHAHKAGDKITIVVERDGKKVTVTATLKEAAQETETTEDDSSNSERSQEYNR